MMYNKKQDKQRAIELRQALKATALDHPFHCVVTHFAFAFSDSHGYVVTCDTDEIRDAVFSFLVTTKKRQVVHNASYDFKHVYFNTRKFPQVYEDTQILAKTLINHCDTNKAQTGLKHLAGHRYGAWGISSDNFDLAHIYDDHVHHYAAIDAAATYWLWSSLQSRF